MLKLFFLQATLVSTVAIAQVKPPDAVSAAFIKQFPGASHVKWGKENAKEYEADFKSKDIKMSANYDLQGNWRETETEIPVNQTPPSIIKSIHDKYAGAVISGVDKIEKPAGIILYEADIKIKNKKKEVLLNTDGRFVH